MRKLPSKRKTLARFMQGKWVKEWDVIRHKLHRRIEGFAVEVSELKYFIRRAAALKETGGE